MPERSVNGFSEGYGRNGCNESVHGEGTNMKWKPICEFENEKDDGSEYVFEMYVDDQFSNYAIGLRGTYPKVKPIYIFGHRLNRIPKYYIRLNDIEHGENNETI